MLDEFTLVNRERSARAAAVRLSEDEDAACLASIVGRRSTLMMLEEVGDHWRLLTLIALQTRPLTYADIRNALAGISKQRLTSTLHGLRRDGLMVSLREPDNDRSNTYGLTPLGASLLKPAKEMLTWLVESEADIADARLRHDIFIGDAPDPNAGSVASLKSAKVRFRMGKHGAGRR